MSRLIESQNLNFWNQIQDPSGIKEARADMNNLIQPVLYEDGISRQIWGDSFQRIGKEDLNLDPDNPNIPTKFVHLPPDLQPYMVTPTDWFQNTTDYRYQGSTIKIRLNPITSKIIKMTKNELMFSPYPMREYCEALIKNDFLAVEDGRFFFQAERIIQARQLAGYETAFTSTNTKWQIDDIGTLVEAFEADRVPLYCVAMHTMTHAGVYKWDQSSVGSFVMKDLIDSGNISDTGRFKNYANIKFFLTNNSDVIRPGVIYGFTAPQMLGYQYMYQSPQIYMEYRRNQLEFWADCIEGGEIINHRGVKKITLAS